MFGSSGGGFGYVAPVWDPAAIARLSVLQRLLALRLPHPAGLNPRAFRQRHLRTPRPQGGGQRFGPPLEDAENGIIDGDLVWRFAGLPRDQQAALAAEAAAQPGFSGNAASVLSDLNQLALATTF